MSGQSITDRIAAAQHSMTGSAISKAVCKATTHEVSGPKKKHLDCEYAKKFYWHGLFAGIPSRVLFFLKKAQRLSASLACSPTSLAHPQLSGHQWWIERACDGNADLSLDAVSLRNWCHCNMVVNSHSLDLWLILFYYNDIRVISAVQSTSIY